MLELLDSPHALASRAVEWNALWERSELASPAFRAEPLGLWLQHFAPDAVFRALTVREGDRLLAALPLVERRASGLRFGMTPNSKWSSCGELLLDPSADRVAVTAALARGVRELPWSWLLLRSVRIRSPAWEAFREAMEASGGHAFAHSTHSVGLVELSRDYDAYLAMRSGNHRRHMRKAEKRAAREGGVRLRVLDGLRPDEVRDALHEGFSVEDRGWKGAAGSSVLRTPGVFEYLTEQAGLLARSGHLHLVYLDFDERAIAFEYGWRSKGVYLTPKVGYDEAYARLSPGQLLRHLLYRQFSGEASPPTVDDEGPLAEATAKWMTDSYEIGHLAVSSRRVLGRVILGAYRGLRASKRWGRNRTRSRDGGSG